MPIFAVITTATVDRKRDDPNFIESKIHSSRVTVIAETIEVTLNFDKILVIVAVNIYCVKKTYFPEVKPVVAPIFITVQPS
jgi:hypothetical protein